MRTLHLPSSYFPASVGGTEVYVEGLCEELVARGHAALVAVHGGTPAAGAHLRHEVRRLPPLPASRPALYLLDGGGEPPGFGELLADWRPDVVHLHAFTLGAGVWHARAAQRRGIPYVITFHTPAMTCFHGDLLRRGAACAGVMAPTACARCILDRLGLPPALGGALAHSPLPWRPFAASPAAVRLAAPALLRDAFAGFRAAFDGAAALVACGGWYRELLEGNGIRARVVVSRQGLPGPSRQRTLRLPLARGRPLRLGFLGRLTEDKGVHFLLRAAPALRAVAPDCRIELAGPLADEPSARALPALAAAEGAELVGTLRGDELRRWLGGLDLLVVPSMFAETGPLVVLEAWDLGVPVVGTDGHGLRETLRAVGLQSLLFPRGDAAGLADAVARALAFAAPAPTVAIRGMADVADDMLALYAVACPRRDDAPMTRR